MAWSTLTENHVSEQLSDAEATAVVGALGGSSSKLAAIVTLVISKIRGCIRAGGYALDDAPNRLPDELFDDAISICRWKLLEALPGCDYLMTDARKEANREALKTLRDLAARRRQVELPLSQVGREITGNWNSENKVVPRLHPLPRPGVQTQTSSGYSNPDADVPSDDL